MQGERVRGHVLEMGLTTRYARAHLRFLITLQLSALKDIILTLRVYRKKYINLMTLGKY